MRDRRAWVLSSVVVAAFGLLAVLHPSHVASAPGDGSVDLQLALFQDGRCGAWADDLPALTTQASVQPGEVVTDTVVCARANRSGQLSVMVEGLVDLDPACTGDEERFDSSCGMLGRGELSGSLVQQVGAGSCGGALSTAFDGTLDSLAHAPRTVWSLRRGENVCVRLLLVYRPPDDASAHRTQSDRTSWRYTFAFGPGRGRD